MTCFFFETMQGVIICCINDHDQERDQVKPDEPVYIPDLFKQKDPHEVKRNNEPEPGCKEFKGNQRDLACQACNEYPGKIEDDQHGNGMLQDLRIKGFFVKQVDDEHGKYTHH